MKKFILGNMDEIIGAYVLLVMSSFAFLNVVTRYLLHFSFSFTEEMTVYLFVWMTMLGSSVAFKEGGVMRVVFFYNKVPKKPRKALYLFIQTVCIVYFTILAYYGILEIIDEVVTKTTSEAIKIPIWWFTSSIPIGSLLIIWRIVQRTWIDLKNEAY